MALKKARLEIYYGGEGNQKGRLRFRFRAKNGEIIATGEGYLSIAGLMNGWASLSQAILSGEYDVVQK